MTEDLATLFGNTEYRVRLERGGWAVIHVGQPLPDSLLPRVGTDTWGFITAWNPQARQQSRPLNRHAQRQLLGVLQEDKDTRLLIPAMGVGVHWREPSLFVTGLSRERMDRIAHAYRQLAYLWGVACSQAELRWC